MDVDLKYYPFQIQTPLGGLEKDHGMTDLTLYL
jgi:hypothetical protein